MTDSRYIPKLYGRRQGKSLKPRQARLMETLLPEIAVRDPAADPAGRPIAPADLFPDAKEIWLEIGFGGGEHLAQQALANPDVGLIGAEPFRDGVGKLLALVADHDIKNIRILEGDARPLMEALPSGGLARLFVLHPDPWPKKRHFKRRMISPWFFEEAARLLAPGGVLRVASDIPDYVRWTLMHAQQASAFYWRAERAADWRERPDDWPQTRYEAKSLKEGRAPAYLEFERV